MEVINEVFLSNRAKQDLIRLFNFHREVHGDFAASELVKNLTLKIEKCLIDKLDVAVRDLELQHLGDCKKLFIGKYKVSFITKNKSAFIIRIFDMRQHPDKNL